VAAAVALLLADAIGDAPVNVAGVGGASRNMNSHAPDFCRTTGVRKNGMTMMCQPQLSRRTRRKRQMTYGSLTSPYSELDICVSDQQSADAGTSSFGDIGRPRPYGRGGTNCAIYAVFSVRVGEFFWRPDFKCETSATTLDLSAITKSTNKEKMTGDLRQPYIAFLLG
jgi:hypothetical protein